MEHINSIVIGAGVVGLAAARELALCGHEVLVLEAEPDIGTGISSRNSEVVHAGIYYPEGSVKAQVCVDGRHRLVDYCEKAGVELKRCGKLIVGSKDDEERLRGFLRSGLKNGVDDLVMISGAQAREMEPALKCDVALHSPSTGIVDSHGLMLAMIGDIEAAGGMVVCRTPIHRAQVTAEGIVVETGGDEPMTLLTQNLVNAAGLSAVEVARRTDGLTDVPELYFAKGNYFDLRGRAPFSRLIYPAPVPGGLGIHLTLDLTGRARFGPDVEWIDAPDYDVDIKRADSFYAAIRRYWPELPDDSLYSAYAGVRPKLTQPGEPAADFRIDGPSEHGIAGLVNLFGIESPGLTSSMSIAAMVVDRLQ